MDPAIVLRRCLTLLAALGLTALPVTLFLQSLGAGSFGWLDVLRALLLALCCFGLAWGFVTSLLGLPALRRAPAHLADDIPLKGRTAILVPIYNEEPADVFGNVAAMDRELERIGAPHLFDLYVLSDSTNEARVRQECDVLLRVLRERGAAGRIRYRHRSPNIGRKAGNIADFIMKSGGAYDYLLILDADSLMRAETMVEMARRMEADPRLGLLQTLPVAIRRESPFGRALQFAGALYAPTFSRGLARLQGREGPFWGHNAIVRTRAFAASCGLPRLSGIPPFGGDILSHDFVEAALLARAGWTVRLDTDLEGSYEEAPTNAIEFARRDRRWCQGNLQHSRLLRAPGLALWSRLTFLQGIMAYAASPIWLAFLVTSLAASALAGSPEVSLGLATSDEESWDPAILLIAVIAVLLLLPRALIVAHTVLSGEAGRLGGAGRAISGALAELLLTSALAPILMMWQSRAVFEVLSGADSGWPASRRHDGSVTSSQASAATWWMVAAGLAGLAFTALYAPSLLPWLLPIVLPLVLAPVLVSFTASPQMGRAAARLGLFATWAETNPEPVIVAAERYRLEMACDMALEEVSTSRGAIPVLLQRGINAAAPVPHAFPIRIPAAKTSAPPSTIW